jgi:hypothetical protein
VLSAVASPPTPGIDDGDRILQTRSAAFHAHTSCSWMQTNVGGAVRQWPSFTEAMAFSSILMPFLVTFLVSASCMWIQPNGVAPGVSVGHGRAVATAGGGVRAEPQLVVVDHSRSAVALLK